MAKKLSCQMFAALTFGWSRVSIDCKRDGKETDKCLFELDEHLKEFVQEEFDNCPGMIQDLKT